jgi:thiol-disulfide isomerase/thioredoxin
MDARHRQVAAFAAVLHLALALASGSANAADALNLEQYRGKVVVVDFWASWCTPCRQSFPWLNELQAKFGKHGLVIVGINVDRNREDAMRFLSAVPANFPIVYDSSGTLASRYDVPGMPSSYVIGPDGAVVAKHIGFRKADRDARENEIRALLPPPDKSLPARGDAK